MVRINNLANTITAQVSSTRALLVLKGRERSKWRFSRKNENKDGTQMCMLPIDPTLSVSLTPPNPPHPVLLVIGRPRRQKLPHHLRETPVGSDMQRGTSILRRAAALRQTPPPKPATPSVPHFQRGTTDWRSTKRDPR